jgi:hypothetical protein
MGFKRFKAVSAKPRLAFGPFLDTFCPHPEKVSVISKKRQGKGKKHGARNAI